MDWAIDRARRRRADYLYLSVFTENERARRFYEKYGFETEGTYAFMVGNHADEDIVMRLTLLPSTSSGRPRWPESLRDSPVDTLGRAAVRERGGQYVEI